MNGRVWFARLAARVLPTTTRVVLGLLFSATNALAQASARFPEQAPAVTSTAAPDAVPEAPVAAPLSAVESNVALPAAKPVSDGNAELPGATQAAPVSWSRRLAQAHFDHAEQLERRGDIAQALSEYTQCLAVDSTLGEAYLRLGGLRERMGDAREAELVYSEAVRMGDTRARALLSRSHLHRAAGHNALALRDLEASVALDANRAALEELARDYVEAHSFGAALFIYRRVLETARQRGDNVGLETARLEVRALRVLAAETDPTSGQVKKHDWVGRSLVHMASR